MDSDLWLGFWLFEFNLLLLGINDHKSGPQWNKHKFWSWQLWKRECWQAWALQIKLIEGGLSTIVFLGDTILMLIFFWAATAVGLIAITRIYGIAAQIQSRTSGWGQRLRWTFIRDG